MCVRLRPWNNGTCCESILMSLFPMFCSVFIFRGQMRIWVPASDDLLLDCHILWKNKSWLGSKQHFTLPISHFQYKFLYYRLLLHHCQLVRCHRSPLRECFVLSHLQPKHGDHAGIGLQKPQRTCTMYEPLIDLYFVIIPHNTYLVNLLHRLILLATSQVMPLASSAQTRLQKLIFYSKDLVYQSNQTVCSLFNSLPIPRREGQPYLITFHSHAPWDMCLLTAVTYGHH